MAAVTAARIFPSPLSFSFALVIHPGLFLLGSPGRFLGSLRVMRGHEKSRIDRDPRGRYLRDGDPDSATQRNWLVLHLPVPDLAKSS